MKQVSQYIQSLIKNSGYSQSRVAREIGVPRQSINYIINGKRDLSISLALRLESYFNLHEGELYTLQAQDAIQDYKVRLKEELVNKLLEVNAFWSYTAVSPMNIPDEELIEKVFIKLDLPDIAKLFELYPKKYIQQVWEEKMIVQGDYLFSLNVMIAQYYFNIKEPEKYIRRIEKYHLEKRMSHA